MEQSQGYTSDAHFLDQVRKHSENYETHKSIYAGMAELLRNRRHEEQHRITEWMAVLPDSNVYLEAVEILEYSIE